VKCFENNSSTALRWNQFSETLAFVFLTND